MNYLIVSPVRSGSTWLNLTLAKHLNLNNVGESLCKISPTLLMDSNIKDVSLVSQLATGYKDLQKKVRDDNFFAGENITSEGNLRKLSRDEQIQIIKKTPFVAKFTPWDLYEGDGDENKFGYEFNKFKELVDPLTTIFLYRKNLLEHYISFWAVHRTGIMNTNSRFMNYKRPRMKYVQEELDLYLAHKFIWEQCYKDYKHNFDYTISYEDLFKMDELCGVPLKQYHEEFTLKLNRYTKEELEECREQTGLEDNYELC
tara:strand:+ start:2554 stop:3324 length:771 start_codon:yes stop_codon:yes gene_type:complete